MCMYIYIYIYAATYCNTPYHCNSQVMTSNTLPVGHQMYESYQISLHHTATHCNTLQHTAIHCNTLQHTATHCNTLQHTGDHDRSSCSGPRTVRVVPNLINQRQFIFSLHVWIHSCKQPQTSSATRQYSTFTT